ncbi:MAG TPA: hypothetical protein VG146_20890 [Verrucomicrobiae bacterium]|nr:hypothetical protein [Verrucomicrobiae bacterium]
MRILLRNTQTGLFYAGPEKWTEHDAEAVDFEKTDRALDTAWASRIASVEVLVRFEEPFFEIPLRVVGFGK